MVDIYIYPYEYVGKRSDRRNYLHIHIYSLLISHHTRLYNAPAVICYRLYNDSPRDDPSHDYCYFCDGINCSNLE